MTEIPIAIEGKQFGPHDPRYLEPGALTWTGEPVPVTARISPAGEDDHWGSTEIVGKATDFRREDGTIYCTVTLASGEPVPDSWAPSIEAHDLGMDRETMHIHGAVIRAIFMLQGWDRAPWQEDLQRSKPARESAVEPWMGKYFLESHETFERLWHGDPWPSNDRDDRAHTAHEWVWGKGDTEPTLADIVARAQEHDVTCEVEV